MTWKQILEREQNSRYKGVKETGGLEQHVTAVITDTRDLLYLII